MINKNLDYKFNKRIPSDICMEIDTELKREDVGYAVIEVCNNYGNILYTTAEGGNILYKAIINNKIKINKNKGSISRSFDILSQLRDILNENKIEYIY